jgi:hypothetical protein
LAALEQEVKWLREVARVEQGGWGGGVGEGERREREIDSAEAIMAKRLVSGGKFVGEFAQRKAVLAKILVSLEEEEEDVNERTMQEQADVDKFSKVLYMLQARDWYGK